MSVFHDDLRNLQRAHDGTADDVRLFHDGTIRIHTITGNGEMGWRVVAPSIPRASVMIGRYFTATKKEQRFLKVANLRLAIEIRDKILVYAAEIRTRREIENDIHNETTNNNRDSVPTTF